MLPANGEGGDGFRDNLRWIFMGPLQILLVYLTVTVIVGVIVFLLWHTIILQSALGRRTLMIAR